MKNTCKTIGIVRHGYSLIPPPVLHQHNVWAINLPQTVALITRFDPQSHSALPAKRLVALMYCSGVKAHSHLRQKYITLAIACTRAEKCAIVVQAQMDSPLYLSCKK